MIPIPSIIEKAIITNFHLLLLDSNSDDNPSIPTNNPKLYTIIAMNENQFAIKGSIQPRTSKNHKSKNATPTEA